MRLLRGLAGALLWIGAALLGLVGVILCVTVILLPVGIPLLGVARRMFTSSVRLMLPRGLAHPAKEMGRSSRKRAKSAKSDAGDGAERAGRLLGKARDAMSSAAETAVPDRRGPMTKLADLMPWRKRSRIPLAG